MCAECQILVPRSLGLYVISSGALILELFMSRGVSRKSLYAVRNLGVEYGTEARVYECKVAKAAAGSAPRYKEAQASETRRVAEGAARRVETPGARLVTAHIMQQAWVRGPCARGEVALEKSCKHPATAFFDRRDWYHNSPTLHARCDDEFCPGCAVPWASVVGFTAWETQVAAFAVPHGPRSDVWK